VALWDDLLSEVYTATNRPDLVSETSMALRQATRQAHKAGKFWKDLQEVSLQNLLTDTSTQELSLPSITTRFRQAAYLRYGEQEDKYLTPISVDDLLDPEGVGRTDVYWGFGTNIRIRARSPQSSYVLGYYSYPSVTPSSNYYTWIAEDHSDVLVLGAAVTVLGLIGEQEIKQRIEQLYAIAYADLISDNLEIQGR
jgi:hypothetical protein